MRKSLRLLVLALVLLPAIALVAPEAQARNAAASERPTVTVAKRVITKDVLRGVGPDVKATVVFLSVKLSLTRPATKADLYPWAGVYVTPYWATLERRLSRMITYEGELRRVCNWDRLKTAGILWKKGGTWNRASLAGSRLPAPVTVKKGFC